MKTLFDEEEKKTFVIDENFVFTVEQMERWAESKNLTHSTIPTKVGEAFILNNKIGLVINPTAESSQQLRDIQQELKQLGTTLYYIYPWDKDTYKLISHFESKLGLDSRKYAAKRLSIEIVSNDVGNTFMKNYHIQGTAGGVGKVSIALKDKKTGEILAVQQFARYRFGITKGSGSIANSPVWEGLRLCFKPGVQIYGGASRLQKYFEENFHPEKIISYINASHSTGQYKQSQGFTDITDWDQYSYMWMLEGEPKIVPIIDKNGVKRVNNLELSKAKPFINPSSMAGSFGKGVGETFYGGRLGSRKQLREHPENGELVENNVILEAIGYVKKHTAGQYKWEKTFPQIKLESDSDKETIQP